MNGSERQYDRSFLLQCAAARLVACAHQTPFAGVAYPCCYRLLEALAEHLTQQMFVAWQCQTIVLELEKPGALGELAKVGVCFTRTRQTD